MNYRHQDGITPLANAVKSGLDKAKLLISFGAKTDIEVGGKDLLSLAVESESLDMIQFVSRDVLSINKSTNRNDSSASKALHRAASLG